MKRILFRLAVLACGLLSMSTMAEDTRYQAKRIVPWALKKPWALQALPDGRWLVTEKAGNMVIMGDKTPLKRVPVVLPDLYTEGQGGFLDLALAQDFALSGRVLLTFAQGTADKNHLAVAVATFADDALSDIEVIFRVSPDKSTPVHFGGRLAVLNDGTWLVTSGDGFDFREEAQRLDSQLGKILRIREDGKPPADNPFKQAPYVYSLGHRNPQGLWVMEDGVVFEHEHGPDGGDEINIILPGNNYGWPVATQGLDYSGARISPFTEYPDMTPPLLNWTPSIAPSSMIYYGQDLFASLRGNLLVTTLKNKAVYAVDLTAKPIRSNKIFATINQRLRDIAVGNDGAIYILTDGDNATIYRVAPH